MTLSQNVGARLCLNDDITTSGQTFLNVMQDIILHMYNILATGNKQNSVDIIKSTTALG